MLRSRLMLAVVAVLIASALAPLNAASGQTTSDGRDDVVVVAVIDGGFNPYHWDYLASKMPQAQDADPSNDLPLTTSPDQWLPGFPGASSFNRFESVDITLEETNPNRSTTSMDSGDTAKWNKVAKSSPSSVNYYWLPGTKVVGAVDFSGNKIHGNQTAHGTGTSSVAVGNFHGSCPECVLVFITYDSCLPSANCPQAENALNWALSQPWIDVVSNSYGFSTAYRDRIYDGRNQAQQLSAADRGQQTFFSAGNGQANTFTLSNTTYFSSQEGPDWHITVGAVDKSGGEYSGGRPVDIAAPGGDYPSAYGGTASVTGEGMFGGTSNATPVSAGLYGSALYEARRALVGPSRIQDGGVIATGTPVACGTARPDCELGDGTLTADELRMRFLHGTLPTGKGIYPTGLIGGLPSTPVLSPEVTFAAQGHGSYFGLLGDLGAEIGRIVEPMLGTQGTLARPSGEREWMTVDSYCRQQIWGEWGSGYYKAGTTALPGPSSSYPVRSALEGACANY